MAVLTLKSEEFRTFPLLLREYASHLTLIQGKSEKTVCEYLLDLRTFFRYVKMRRAGDDLSHEELEKISISDIALEDAKGVTPELIIEFLMYAGFSLDNSSTTRSRKLSSLRSFFRYLHAKKHLIDKNPTVEIDTPKIKKALPKFLTYDECIQLLETVRADSDSKTLARDYCIIVLFLNTGLRLSELVGLNLTSFDTELTRMKVVGKGNKERVVYLNELAQRSLMEYLRTRLDPRYIHTDEKALFLSARQARSSPKTVQWIVYKYLKLAGFEHKGLSVHKLRHTAATLMFQSGEVDIRVIKDVLGHEQLNTTQIYTHVINRNLEDAVAANPLAGLHFKKRRSDDDDRSKDQGKKT